MPSVLSRIDRRKALILGLGGALFNLVYAWTYQGVLEFFLDVRALELGIFMGPFFALFIGGFFLIVIGVVLGLLDWPMRLLWVWMGGCALLWLLSVFVGPIPLWLFLAYWTAFGVVVPLRLPSKKNGRSDKGGTWQQMEAKVREIHAQQETSPRPQQRRQHARGAALSNYGRIPQSTVEMATQWVQATRNVVREALPQTAPALWHHTATRAILDHLFNAWAQHGVSQVLDGQNQAMVRDFLALAAAVAGSGDDPLADAVFGVSLNALLDSWRGALPR